MEKCLPDIFVIEETKLSSEFKTEFLLVNNYQTPILQDRNGFGGDLMQFIRNGVVCDRVSTFENSEIDCICSELMVCKKRWVVFGVYGPPEASNLELFLENRLLN